MVVVVLVVVMGVRVVESVVVVVVGGVGCGSECRVVVVGAGLEQQDMMQRRRLR